MKYQIVRSKRKTMAIYILENGVVEVRCPNQISDYEIKKFVSLKSAWIDKKVSESIALFSQKQKYTLDFSSKLLFMGIEYPLIKADKAFFDGNVFCSPELNLKQNILAIYKHLAEEIIKEKVMHFSKIMVCTPTDVKINSAKTRWGSCSGKNSLNFTWMLIMAEEKAIDYVIIHELAHIKEHNHSKKFWSIVEHYMPNYKIWQITLKSLAHIIS